MKVDHVPDLANYLPTYSPWETAGGITELALAQLFRGAIISSFGMIETQLNEIALRCSKIELYHELSLRFPWKTDERLAFLKKAFVIDGVLFPYQIDALEIISSFQKMLPTRNMWAHGHLKVLPGHQGNRWHGASITIEHYNPGNGAFIYERKPLTGSQIQQIAFDVKELADKCNALHCDVRDKLPAVI